MLKFSACSENYKKLCWTFQYVLKTVTHVEKVCWKFQCMLKTVMQVQNYVEYFKVCWKTSWKFQGMLKTVICVENYVETACWTFQCVLKTVMQVQNYVETACWKFQCVLKTVMHVENYIEISRCVENVYVRHVENCVEIRKNRPIRGWGGLSKNVQKWPTIDPHINPPIHPTTYTPTHRWGCFSKSQIFIQNWIISISLRFIWFLLIWPDPTHWPTY